VAPSGRQASAGPGQADRDRGDAVVPIAPVTSRAGDRRESPGRVTPAHPAGCESCCCHDSGDKENTMSTSLPTDRLGWTDMHITRVGFGAWAIGGGGWAYAWGGQDDAESIAAIRYAVESGINWIDTAAVYGLGHSEEMVAAALAGIPEADRPYIFTKGGLVWNPADRAAAPRRVGDPASLRAEVVASLRRLNVERIDLYQMHWPAQDGTPVEEYWQVFTDLKREGKIRAAGLSNHDIWQLETAGEIGNVDAIQPPFNLTTATPPMTSCCGPASTRPE
jgi:aryl-alcohol dehydrogenase-like predicted oxidoreductase